MEQYVRSIQNTYAGAQNEHAIEMSYYGHLQHIIQRELDHDTSGVNGWRIEINFGAEGTFPDFSIYNEEGLTVARIEAKPPEVTLNQIITQNQKQLTKYLDVTKSGHPNLIITNFLSFSLAELTEDQVITSGDVTILFESADALQNFPIEPDSIDALRGTFREFIGQITNLQPQEINTAESTTNLLGQIMWATGGWITLARNDHTFSQINETDVKTAQLIADLATNLIISESNDTSRDILLGQLFIVGLILNERKARLSEAEMPPEEVGCEVIRLSRRNLGSEDLLPSSRLSRIIRLIFTIRSEIGIKRLVDTAKRALMLRAPDSIINFRGLEDYLLDFMRSEFEDWVVKFGQVPTPQEAIEYMVSRANETLKNPNQDNPRIREMGLLSKDCQILDPATGGGHYYIAVLSKIYDLALENGGTAQYAQSAVRNAIGQNGVQGRVHAVDIQPMCITLTNIHLAEFCEGIGISENEIKSLEPRIYLGDTLKPRHIDDYTGSAYEDSLFGAKDLVIGNPPWGSFKSAEGVEANKDNVKRLLRPFRTPYLEKMQGFTGNKPKLANPAIEYAFFANFTHAENEKSPIVCFIMPSTVNWAPSWVGMREWILENGMLRIDKVGGNTHPINRSDGENIFDEFDVGQGNSIYTFIPDHPEPSVIALALWEVTTLIPEIEAIEGGEGIDAVEAVPETEIPTLTSELKRSKLQEWSLDLPDDDQYSEIYDGLNPIFSYFIPPGAGVIEGAPQLANLIIPGKNFSGMEPAQGKQYRLINANGNQLEQQIGEMLGHPTYANALAAGGKTRFLAEGLGKGNTSEDNFNSIKEHNCENQFSNISLAAMSSVRAYTPRILNDNGKDILKSWYALRVHEIMKETHEVYGGYFGFPDSADTIANQEFGYQCLHLRYYPGYKHAAGQKNGRAVPPVVRVQVGNEDPQWRVNVSDTISSWLSQNYDGFDTQVLETGQIFWDYVLAISSSNIVQTGLGSYCGYELSIPFPQDYELFLEISELGKVMRLLQTPVRDLQVETYDSIRQVISAMIPIEIENSEGDLINLETEFRIRGMKYPNQLKARALKLEDSELSLDDDRIQELSDLTNIHNEEIRAILGPMQKISLDHYDQNICIRGVPLNIALFTLGNRKVLRDWVSHHTDLRVEDNCLMHTTWNNDTRDEWFLEMSTVIHNIATLLLVRPRIEEYSAQVCANMLQWPPNEE